MVEDLNELWQSLENDVQLDKSGLLLRKLHSSGLYVGIDLLNNQRILAVEVRDTSKIIVKDLPRWKGVDLEITELDTPKKALLLRLVDKENTDIFNALIKDFDESLTKSRNPDDSLGLFIDCLERWRVFFDKYGSNILSPEAQRGLFGELFFLYNHVFAITDYVKGVHYWRGHDRKNQDFSFPGGNIEIKTTIKKEHKSVVINSEKQLDDSGLISLYLYCLAINSADKQGCTLPQMIKDIRNKIAVSSSAVSIFNIYLNHAGYLDEHDKYYMDSGYIPEREYFYKIRTGFPRIISLPSGVGDIKYSIVLSSCTDFEVEIEPQMREIIKESLL